MESKVFSYTGPFVGPAAAKGITNKLFDALEASGFTMKSLAAGKISGSDLPAPIANRIPVFSMTSDSSGTAYTANYNIPGFSNISLNVKIGQYYHGQINGILLFISLSIVNSQGLEGTRIYIPLMDSAATYAASSSTVRISTTDFSGFSIYISPNIPSVTRRVIYGEPIYSLASATPDGYMIGEIGNNPYTAQYDTSTGYQVYGTDMTPKGAVDGAALLAGLALAFNDTTYGMGNRPNAPMSLANQNYVTVCGNDGSFYSGAANSLGGMNGGANKLSYTGSQGEKIYIPNGPMIATDRFISQRSRMIALISSKIMSVGEILNVLEPTAQGVTVYPYTIFDYDSKDTLEDSTYVVGIL